MKRWLSENPVPILLLLSGMALHFIGISHPADVVWDESLFERFSQGYLDGRYFFDRHPPLGWLLMAASLKMAGAPSPNAFSFAEGAAYPASYPYLAARLLPALAGSLLPLVIYLVARALGLSKRASLLAGVFVLLENALLAYSRVAMIDIFLHLFIFSALLCYLHHRKSEPYSGRWWGLLSAAGLLAGLAMSVKWTGVGALGVMAVTTLTEAAERKRWRIVAARAPVLALLAVAVYFPLVALHLRLLPRSGPGDIQMTPEFLAGLEGTRESRRPEIPPLGTVGRVMELNRRMYYLNTDIGMTHPESSRWYQWPFGWRLICFWVDRDDAEKRIFLFGNPVVWGFGTASLLAGLAFAVKRRSKLRELMDADPAWKERVASLEFLLVAYFMYLLPFASISRAMFLYHYFTAYIASILLGAFLVVDLVPAVGWSGGIRGAELRPRAFKALLALAAAGFLFAIPVTYGFRPLPLQSALLPRALPVVLSK